METKLNLKKVWEIACKNDKYEKSLYDNPRSKLNTSARQITLSNGKNLLLTWWFHFRLDKFIGQIVFGDLTQTLDSFDEFMSLATLFDINNCAEEDESFLLKEFPEIA